LVPHARSDDRSWWVIVIYVTELEVLRKWDVSQVGYVS
jgi:hypothetical protein